MGKTTLVVKLQRKNGVIVQDCDVYIGRACNMGGWRLPQSKWHNPFPAKTLGREESIKKYETYIRSNKTLLASLSELKGKRLGCWCKPLACHGDVLVKLLKEQNKNKKENNEKDEKDEEGENKKIKEIKEKDENKNKKEKIEQEINEKSKKRKRNDQNDEIKKNSKKLKKEEPSDKEKM